MSESLLFRKIYGSIVGCAIGDAMGAAVETMHYKDIEEKAGKVTSFLKQFDRHPDLAPENRPYYETMGTAAGPGFRGRTRPWGPFKDMAGAYTDDTRIQLLYYEALIRKNGRITGRDVARHLLEYRLTDLGVSKNPTFHWNGGALERTMIETHPWFDPFLAYSDTRPMRSIGIDAPAGVINAFDPESAAKDGYVVAAAVAEAMKPDATVDSIIDAVISHSDCLGRARREFVARVEKVLEIAKECRDVFALRQPFYERLLARTDYWMESIPCVLAMLHIAQGDPELTIIGTVNFGRDSDTIAAIAGQLVGAFRGSDAFPEEWVRQVTEANPEVDMYQVAQEVCQVVVKILRERERSVSYLSDVMK
jgi:ADP-ribosylglycohydrolase